MPQPLTIVLVEKTGELKTLSVKDYKEDELFKKCGFKKEDDFTKQVDWPVKLDDKKYMVSMYGKTNGKANMENKYDFPPPVDNKLFFGCCVLVCQVRDEVNLKSLTNLSLDLWNKIYDKLFGGFENLTLTKCDDDDCDDDELAVIPKSKKTKNSNYLKDGFVVDDDASDEDGDESGSSSESDDESGNINDINDKNSAVDDGFILEDIGSELSEDEYDYN